MVCSKAMRLRSASAPREFIRADPPISRISQTLGFFIKFLMRFLIDNFRFFCLFVDLGSVSGSNLESKSDKNLEKCGFGKGTEVHTVFGLIFE